MQHQESPVKVYQTNEYSRFKFLNGNRELDERKVKRIIEDIEAGIDVLKYYPLVVREVGERLEIDDGQHRFHISKTLRRPVYYIIAEEKRELVDIAKINSNTEKWKTKDFIHCYVQQGNENYIMLRDLAEKHGLTPTLCMRLLETGTPGYAGMGRDGLTKFQRGEFQVLYPKEAALLIEAVKRFEDFKSWKNTDFFRAIHLIMSQNRVPIEDLAEKYQAHKEELIVQPGAKEYIANLEMIYNKRRRERVILYE